MEQNWDKFWHSVISEPRKLAIKRSEWSENDEIPPQYQLPTRKFDYYYYYFERRRWWWLLL